jgi:hypothetical protein
MISLDDVFEQALGDRFAISLNGKGYESRLVYGIKIVRDIKTRDVIIINTQENGDYYKPIKEKEIEIFLEKGWRYGVYTLSLSNYRATLDLIESEIHSEINGRKRSKKVSLLKEERDKIMVKYRKTTLKLNENGK